MKGEIKATIISELIYATAAWGVLDLGAVLASKGFGVLMLLEDRRYVLGQTGYAIWVNPGLGQGLMYIQPGGSVLFKEKNLNYKYKIWYKSNIYLK